MSSITTVGPRTLADVIPGGLVRSIALVVGGAGLVGLTAQVGFKLPFTATSSTEKVWRVSGTGLLPGTCKLTNSRRDS